MADTATFKLEPPAKSSATIRAEAAPAKPAAATRLLSLDAYRGLIMVALMFNGFGLAATAKNHLKEAPDSTFWAGVNHHFSHVEWLGCGFWDLIQPSFMFMVGVSMAYSYVKRQQQGASWLKMFGHACWRAVVLMALGIFLTSTSANATEWQFMNVLTQIGLGYPFLFLLWQRRTAIQGVVAAALLAITYVLYVMYPTAGISLETGDPEVGITAEWAKQNLTGVAPAWHKSANVGQAVDLWLLNQFPRSKPFTHNAGGYQTINFIPELATMIFGLMCGELLRSQRAPGKKAVILLVAGLAGLALGFGWSQLGCPLVKKIWTPSWGLFSTGWCVLILCGFYVVIDVVKVSFWAFPLVVVGTNSIAAYCLGMLLRGWTLKSLQVHLGQPWVGKGLFGWATDWIPWANPELGIFGIVPPADLPFLQATLVGLVFWLVLLWMYRRKIFLRI